MIEQGERILLGLSGGADSILLARYLLELRQKNRISLHAVHVNHKLRGEEAGRDQEFVENFCRRWEIPLKVFEIDVARYAKEHKQSFEEAGREVRIQCMKEYAEYFDCQKIALAHHQNDLVETMIFRMIRGTGPQGLVGIHPVYDNRIRPLLSVDKEEILGILKQLGQEYVEDSSNESLDYSRNYIRHKIVPELCQVNGQTLQHLFQLSEHVREENQYLEGQLQGIYEANILRKDGLAMSITFLQDCHPYCRKELLRRMLMEACQRKKDITATHVDILDELLYKEDGKRNDLPYGILAIKKKGMLYMAARPSQKEKVDATCIRVDQRELEDKGFLKISLGQDRGLDLELFDRDCLVEDWKISKKDCVKCFDYDKIKDAVFIRKRKDGDYFVMDASGRRKKLNRYFIDEKVEARMRDRIDLLAEGNHILWICKGRISEAYKVTDTTRRMLQVSYWEEESQ